MSENGYQALFQHLTQFHDHHGSNEPNRNIHKLQGELRHVSASTSEPGYRKPDIHPRYRP